MSNKFKVKQQDIYITPPEVYHDFESTFGIENLEQAFDPCPYPESNDDGLMIDWGDVTYCNPPFSQTKTWFIKAKQQANQGKVVYFLAPWYFVYNNKNRQYPLCDMHNVIIGPQKRYTFESPVGLSPASITCFLLKIKN